MGKEYVLQYYNEDSDGYYTIDANENGEMIINLNEPIEKVATIYLSKKYDMSFSLSSDNFDIQTGIITLKNPIPQNANITYRRNSQAGGYLEIVFYYRLRELNSRFLSNLKPDWNANGIDDPNYIANRPLWIDTVNNETRIVMESGNPELGYRYSNHQSHYLEFFQELILETVDLLDYEVSLSGLGQQIKDLQDKVAKFEHYFYEWQVPGFEEYGKGVLELIKSILEWLKRLQDELNRKTEIHIGTNPPPEDGLNKYKMWVNTDTNNGNGLIYYYHEGMSKWIPVSALWSESADADALD